jgi:hypothetical protein
MASTKQAQVAKRNVKKAQKTATTAKQTIAHMPKQARTALGKQGAAVAQRKRTGGSSPKTKAELYQIAQQRDLPGRSKMGREELAKALRLS